MAKQKKVLFTKQTKEKAMKLRRFEDVALLAIIVLFLTIFAISFAI